MQRSQGNAVKGVFTTIIANNTTPISQRHSTKGFLHQLYVRGDEIADQFKECSAYLARLPYLAKETTMNSITVLIPISSYTDCPSEFGNYTQSMSLFLMAPFWNLFKRDLSD